MKSLLSRPLSRARTRLAAECFRQTRLLNAARSVSAPAAYLAGADAFGAMMRDAEFAAFVRQAIYDEILPTIAAPEVAKHAMAESVLRSLTRSVVADDLLATLRNPVSQWRDAVLPALLDYHRSRGTIPPALAFSLAATVSLCRGRGIAPAELEGIRGGRPYRLAEDAKLVAFFTAAWSDVEMSGDWYAFAYATLRHEELWGEDLNRLRGFVGTLAQDLATIATSGPRAAVASLNAAQR